MSETQGPDTDRAGIGGYRQHERDLEMAWHLYAWGDKMEVLEPERLAAMVHDNRTAWPVLP